MGRKYVAGRLQSNMIIMIFIGFLFFLIGIVVLISGIVQVFKVRRQIAGSVKAPGKVFGMGRINGQRGYLYCPQVEFRASNAQTYKFQSEVGSQPPAYKIGQSVQVVYEPADPNQAEIDSFMAMWFMPGCMVLFALVFSMLGLALFGIGVLVEINQ